MGFLMKKFLVLTILVILSSLSLHADLLRIEGAAGAWKAEPSGEMNYKKSARFDLQETLAYNSDTITYAWILVKHPIPVLPNLRLEYDNLDYSGVSKKGYTWEGTTVGVGAKSTLSLKQYDAIMYYNVLDNTFWATLDLGLDAKFIKASFDINDPGDNYAYSASDNIVLPMLYGRVRAEVPLTNIGVEADMKWIGYGSVDAYEIRIKADYTFDAFIVEPMVELGYRTLVVNIDSSDYDIDGSLDADFSGFYMGVGIRY